MRRSSTSSVGSLHPVLFFIFIYGISLVQALFVCRTVYYSLNGNDAPAKEVKADIAAGAGLNATALK